MDSQQVQQASDNGWVLIVLAIVSSATFLPQLVKVLGLIINYFKSKSDKSVQARQEKTESLEEENRRLRSEKDLDYAKMKSDLDQLRDAYFNMREELIEFRGTVKSLDSENTKLKNELVKKETALEHARNEARRWKDKYNQLQNENYKKIERRNLNENN